MINIGISGKIGSGKSLISSFFLEREDSYVVDCDKIASKLIESDSDMLQKIQEAFGKEAVVEGKLHREFLRKKIFSSSKELKKMNAITHKALRDHIEELIVRIEQTGRYKFLVIEAAVLFEANLYKLMDRTIWVDSSLENSIKRVKSRDNNTERQVIDIYSRQTEYEDVKDDVDIVIQNNDSKSKLKKMFEEKVLTELD